MLNDEQVSTRCGTVVGFPKKPMPLGKLADMLTWGRWYACDWDESRWKSREHAMVRWRDDPERGEAPKCRSQAQ